MQPRKKGRDVSFYLISSSRNYGDSFLGIRWKIRLRQVLNYCKGTAPSKLIKLQHVPTWVICLRVLISKIRNSFINKIGQSPSTCGSSQTKNKKAKTKNSTKCKVSQKDRIWNKGKRMQSNLFLLDKFHTRFV